MFSPLINIQFDLVFDTKTDNGYSDNNDALNTSTKKKITNKVIDTCDKKLRQ